MTDEKIPVTIITGFLGTGKTTLIKRLCERSPRRVGVIQNEFSSEMGIERPALLRSGAELYELPNGCICCSTKDGLVTAVESVLQYGIEWIVIEAAGTADPVVLAGNFWLDHALESPLLLDGVICVTDARVLEMCMGVYRTGHSRTHAIPEHTMDATPATSTHSIPETRLAIKQLSVADLIIVNKTDMHPLKAETEACIKALNGCRIITTVNCSVDLDEVSNLNMFDTSKLLQNDPPCHATSLKNLLVKTTKVYSLAHINNTISSFLWDQDNVYRCKGIFRAKRDCEMIDVEDGTQGTFELQGVGQVFEITPIHADIQENKFLFIGHNLDRDRMSRLLS